ncbi:MAG: DUF4143 domain-containing protein [Actinobacteria bacterium]|nr:DUF4143 domain-containing protein [Actinomycetota bacterium]
MPYVPEEESGFYHYLIIDFGKDSWNYRAFKPDGKLHQEELSKNPGIYFVDNDFRNYLTENYNRLNIRNDAGPLVENIVFRRISGDAANIIFLRTKTGTEVDYVLFLKEKTIPLEVKFAVFKIPVIPRSFISFIKYFKPDHGLILTKDYWGKTNFNGTKVLFAPVYFFSIKTGSLSIFIILKCHFYSTFNRF